MPAIRLARRPAVRLSGRAARVEVVLLVALAGLLVAGRLQAPPAVRTIAVGRAPTAVAVDARTRRVFVANFLSATVTVLDAGSGTMLATTAAIPFPDTLALATTSGRVFVLSAVGVSHGPSDVAVLDATSGRLLRTVAVGHGAHAVAVQERASHIFVTNSDDNSVSMLDARSGHVLRIILVGQSPRAVAVDEPLSHAFVLNGGQWFNGYQVTQGTVSMLDARSGTVLRTLVVGYAPSGLAVDARSGHVFVSNQGSNTVSVLDARSGSVLATVPVGRGPAAVVVDAARGRVVVLTSYDHGLSILDVRTGRVVHTVALYQGSSGHAAPTWSMVVAVQGRTGRAVVANGDADTVSVLDVRSGAILHTVIVGLHPLAVGLDERTTRAFVVNYGRTVAAAAGWWAPWLQELRRWLPWFPYQAAPAHTDPGSISVLDLARL